MKKLLTIFLVILFIFTTLSACAKPNDPNPPSSSTSTSTADQTTTPPDEPTTGPSEQELKREQAAKKIDEYLSEKDYWGAVLVRQRDQTIFGKAYGMADAAQGIENTLDTPFCVGSVTKQFTGAAILTLEMDGKLDTLEALDKFFPGYDGLENVTVADLLAMKGGFGDYLSELSISIVDLMKKENIASFDDLDEAWLHEKLNTLPMDIGSVEEYILTNWGGQTLERFSYSNSDYFLLGRIIEKVSGMTYEEYLTEKLLRPVGMTNSGFLSSITPAVPDSGGGYVLSNWQNICLEYTDTFFRHNSVDNLYSTGGLYSTANDLNLWLDAYFNGKLFPKSMLEKVAGSYNYGWFREGLFWEHTGYSLGFRTFVYYNQNNGNKIIMLTNREPASYYLFYEWYRKVSYLSGPALQ